MVARYQAGEASGFDNRVLLLPGVGEFLLQLSGLLRPLIQRRWAAMVADWRCNGLKSNSLAAAQHVARWARRFSDGASERTQLDELAKRRWSRPRTRFSPGRLPDRRSESVGRTGPESLQYREWSTKGLASEGST